MSEPGAVGGDASSMATVIGLLTDMKGDIEALRLECSQSFQSIYTWQNTVEKNILALQESSKDQVGDVQNLQTEVNQIRNDLQNLTVNPGPRGGAFGNAAITPLPKKFAGEPGGFENYLVQCQLHFRSRPNMFTSDEQKINFMLMLLEGRALQWASPLIKREDAILKNYRAFSQLITNVFEKKYHVHTRKQEFLNVQQGKFELISYIAHFQTLAAEVGWSEDAQVALFHKGLREDLKDALAGVHPLPENLQAFFDLCLRVNHRIKERKGGSKWEFKPRVFNMPTNDTVEPMVIGELKESLPRAVMETQNSEVIGELRGPLTEAERKRRRELHLCFYCGKAGHSIGNCLAKQRAGNEKTPREGRP